MTQGELDHMMNFLPVVMNFVILIMCLACTVVVCWMFSYRLKQLSDQHSHDLTRMWGQVRDEIVDNRKQQAIEFGRLHDVMGDMSLSLARLTSDTRLLPANHASVGLDRARVSTHDVVFTCDDSGGMRRMMRKVLDSWANERGIDVVVTPDVGKYSVARETMTKSGRKIFGNVMDWTLCGDIIRGITEPVVILTATPEAVTSDVLGMPNVTVFDKADGRWPTALPKELERLAKVCEDLRGAK